MLSRQGFPGVLTITLSICVLLFLQASVALAANGPTTADDGMEVLTRGPIHEAFADVSVDEEQPVMVASRSVPDPIHEVPPDYRPEGDNVQWISGYWSWDDDRNDFIWVSGIWRDVPPGRQWIPGYWMSVAGGNQFVSGYWTDINTPETVYLPPPPEPLQAVPGSPTVSSDNMWIDGHWLWSNNGYVWQAGFWLRQRPEMVWIPTHYVWTPRGYVFVRGYWDYQLVRRGVMFAPRYYSRPIYRNHDYYYSPSIVLNIDSIFLSLFIRRGHRHYYFGDYYDTRYERRGFLPWYSNHATRYGYDPCYRSYRWSRLRDDKEWEHNYHQQYQYRRDHREARPPVVYRSQLNHDFDRSHGEKNKMLGRPLAEVVKNRDQQVRFTHVRPDHKKGYQEHDRKLTTSQTERRTVEMVPDKKRKDRGTSDANTHEQVKRSAPQRMDNYGQPHFPEKQEGKYQGKQYVRPQQRTINQPRDNQVQNQPLQIEDVRNDQSRSHQQKRERREVKDQPNIQPQVPQPRRFSPEKEDRPHVERQVKPQRSESMEEKAQKNIRRQADRPGSRPLYSKDQQSDLPQVKQKVKRPLIPEEQAEEQGVLNDNPEGKRPRKSWDQRAN